MTEQLKKVQTLKEWMEEHFDGHQTNFAKAQRTTKQLTGQWLSPKNGEDYIVVDGRLYLPRRVLNTEILEDKDDE